MDPNGISAGQDAPESRSLAVIPVSLGVAVAALLLFVWLFDQVLHSGTERFDLWMRLGIHAHATPTLTEFMRAITHWGSWMVLLPATLFVSGVLVWRRRRDEMRLLLITMGGAVVLDNVLKLVVHRPRPTPFFVGKPMTFSFPSGHSLISLCFYGLLAGLLTLHMTRGWSRAVVWGIAAILIGLIGLSRIYLGVHWPSDVIAGYAAAIVWMGAVRLYVLPRIVRSQKERAG
ncbi:MAG TPA: phosphatase PAP2 family protein [Terriglobia bacterium]|nr:phosphatase PAP2 family protein [Terriglobia bacterium]